METADLLTDDLAPAWDAYVAERPDATVYHLSGWRDVIRSVFGQQLYYLHSSSMPGKLSGILPLVRLRSRMFGDYLVSLPYVNYGGALTNSPELKAMLMEAAGRLASQLGCRHIEFRDTEPQKGWPERTDKVVMELALPADVDALWKSFGPKLRAQIRKPIKAGATVVHGGRELLPEFYSVFARNMRDLGTPVYSQHFFGSILAAFPQHASLSVVRVGRTPVAAGFLLGFRQRLEIPWASSLREYNSLGVNMLLYSEVLNKAIQDGYRLFDFGRSTVDGGTYRFKKQWGAIERPLYWHYWLAHGQKLPQLTPSNPKYRFAIAMWKRLPLAIANRLGPHIVKNLP